MKEVLLHIIRNIMLLVIAILFFIPFSSNATITNAFKLTITNASYSDETVIRYLPGATPGFDGSYDSWKMFSSNPVVPSIYTMIGSVSSLSINALPELLTDVQVKIFVKVGSVGNYSITATELGAFAYNVDMFIENTVTEAFQNLRTAPVYTFTVSDTALFNSNPGKFIIHFSLPVIFSITYATKNNNNGACIISKKRIDSWTYRLTNNSTTVIASATINRDKDTITNLWPGTYSFLSYFGNNTTQLQTFVVPALTANFTINTDTLIGLNTTVDFLNLSQNTTDYLWNFGDESFSSKEQNPSHTYSIPGNFPVKLIAQNGTCSDSTVKIIHVTVTTQIANPPKVENCKLFFNDNVLVVDFNYVLQQHVVLSLFTIDGREVISKKLSNSSKITIPINEQAKGIYVVKLQTDETNFIKKVLIN